MIFTYGWSYCEKVYKFRHGLEFDIPELRSKHNDNRIGWRSFPLRSQESLENWKIKRDQYEGVVIPAELDREGKPTGYKLSLMTSGGRRPADADVVIKRYEWTTRLWASMRNLLIPRR